MKEKTVVMIGNTYKVEKPIKINGHSIDVGTELLANFHGYLTMVDKIQDYHYGVKNPATIVKMIDSGKLIEL